MKFKIQVRQYADGRWGFDDHSTGTRKMVRLWSKQKAEQRAMDVAVLLSNGRSDLLGVSAAELAEFRAWKSESKESPSIADACTEFVKLKSARSSSYVHSLEGDLELFTEFVGPTKTIGTIMALDIQHFLTSREVGQRRQFNLRAAVVSLFKWARRMSYLPDRTTEAEKVEPIAKIPGTANVLTPAQMQTLLENVRPEYMPWLAVGGFAGIRSEEIAPDYRSKKSPLAWQDFDWPHQVIIVRSETAKTREEREVPISANLALWLANYRNATGPVCAGRPSNYETQRLGTFIGGWKHNALRDSFCSYRARILQDVPRVSYEMGNSIAMVKRSYHRRQPIHTAQEWFNLLPPQDSKLIAFA
jgi:integrase